MISILLRAAVGPVVLLQMVLALYFLLRGHNLPGGGFIAGLLAASSVVVIAIAHDAERARRALRVSPTSLMGVGLLVSLVSGLFGPATRRPYMEGLWGASFWMPGVGKVGLGTPFLFDVGVFLVVLGMTASVLFALFSAGRRP